MFDEIWSPTPTPITEYAPPPPATASGYARGIDVSRYQLAIDWRAVAADGVAFAIAKASEGSGADKRFRANWPAMAAAGVARSAYHYLRTHRDPVLQAEAHLRIIDRAGGLVAGDLPPVVDVEEANNHWLGMPVRDRAVLVARWLDRVERAIGVKPMIYTSTRIWSGNRFTKGTTRGLFDDLVEIEHAPGRVLRFGDYPLWVARWSSAVGPLPTAWRAPGWAFWQYSSKGVVPGIGPAVDLDVFNGTIGDLRAWIAGRAAPDRPRPPVPGPVPPPARGAMPGTLRDDPARIAVVLDALAAARAHGATGYALVDAGFYAAHPALTGTKIDPMPPGPDKDGYIADWKYVRNKLVPRLAAPAAIPTPSAPAPAAAAAGPEPAATAVAFAPPTGRYWPVKTSAPEGRLVSYQTATGALVGRTGRRFLADRAGGARNHAGIDLFAAYGDPILACEGGVIVAFYHFYKGTNALLVQHDSGTVINYGEVDPRSLDLRGLRIGSRVEAGQSIAQVGRMTGGSSMLHFETYAKGTTRSRSWWRKDPPPAELRDPTRYLLALAGGAAAPVAPPTPPPPTPAPGGLIRSSAIRVGGQEFGSWFNGVFQPAAADVFEVAIKADNWRRLWDHVPALFGRPAISLAEHVAHFCIMYNEVGGKFVPITEYGGKDNPDAYFFEYRERKNKDPKASYNGSKRSAAGRLDPYKQNFAGDQLLAWKAIREPADVAAWNSQHHYPDVPPPETRDRWTPATWKALKEYARNCDFYKYRGRGLIGITWRYNYVDFVDPVLRQVYGRASDAMTNEDLDRAFANPQVYIAATCLLLAKQASKIAKVNADPPQWAPYGAAISGGKTYGAGVFSKRCERLYRAMLAAGYEAR
jgi:lysozyme